MREHFHLLISEPKTGSVSVALQVLKQRVARRCRKQRKDTSQMAFWDTQPARAFWQRRYYDFNVFRERKHVEKLRYIHRNPVKRKLVASPELWRWSSFSRLLAGRKRPGESGDLNIPPFAPQRVGHPKLPHCRQRTNSVCWRKNMGHPSVTLF